MVNEIPEDWWIMPLKHNSQDSHGHKCEIVTCTYIKKDGTVCGMPGCLGPWKDVPSSKRDPSIRQLIKEIVMSYQRHNGNWVKVANEVFIVYQKMRVQHAHWLDPKEAQGRNTSHIIKKSLRRSLLHEFEVVTQVVQHPKIPDDKLGDMG